MGFGRGPFIAGLLMLLLLGSAALGHVMPSHAEDTASNAADPGNLEMPPIGGNWTALKVYVGNVTKESDGILVEVYVKNEGSEPVTFYCGEPMLFVEVRDANGTQLGIYPNIVVDVLIRATLGPGRIHRERVKLKLPGGEYRIRAFAELSFDAHYRDSFKIWSEPLTVSV
ncbi:hypothetical protein [Thermococcus sp. AM4]|uniref:hypothetical protein n=1 Tax=Thermococcus sp. (strain AM4) TaxID=246969 RepID=UPI0001870731|nr:hypothetical protein [Thermococcus sp. AM4]EEB73328.1 hypothetical protein TAM4_2185 [Thermococcus sp. AM4]